MTTLKEKFRQQGLNVLDEYKGLEPKEIRAKVLDKSFPCAVAMINIGGDFNFSSVVRNANAFGFRKVFHVADSKKWDRRGAVGTHLYTEVCHYSSVEELFENTKDYVHIALENNLDYTVKSIYDINWPANTLLILGEEGQGLSEVVLGTCQELVSIPQYGSVRSLNAATACGIAMNSYCQQWSKI